MRIGIASVIHWSFIQQRPQRFAEELAALGHTIFYLEPYTFGLGRTRTIKGLLQHGPHMAQVAPRLYTLRPMLYPPFRAHANRQWRNRWLLPFLVRQLQWLRLDFIIVMAPEYAPAVLRLGIPFAYDHLDDTQLMEHVDTDRYLAAMNQLVARSAFNIYIQERAAQNDPKGLYIANGADPEVFFPLAAPKLFDAVVLSNIAKWFDMDAILASQQRILLIGPMDLEGGTNQARYFAANRSNLSWIPQVDKQVANQWLSRSEVGLVPFDYRHPVVEYAMPIKILEYFLAQLPVVTYHNRGIEQLYGDHVTFYARDGSQPLDLDAAIQVAKTKRTAYDYRAFALNYQWRDLVAALERHIATATGSSSSAGQT